jgi:predicted transcriptional regulator
MSKTITLRLKEEVYRVFLEASEAENRPLSNLIETAALQRIRETQFMDDAEMAELAGNEKLLARMKKGSRDARAGRGKRVD